MWQRFSREKCYKRFKKWEEAAVKQDSFQIGLTPVKRDGKKRNRLGISERTLARSVGYP